MLPHQHRIVQSIDWKAIHAKYVHRLIHFRLPSCRRSRFCAWSATRHFSTVGSEAISSIRYVRTPCTNCPMYNRFDFLIAIALLAFNWQYHDLSTNCFFANFAIFNKRSKLALVLMMQLTAARPKSIVGESVLRFVFSMETFVKVCTHLSSHQLSCWLTESYLYLFSGCENQLFIRRPNETHQIDADFRWQTMERDIQYIYLCNFRDRFVCPVSASFKPLYPIQCSQSVLHFMVSVLRSLFYHINYYSNETTENQKILFWLINCIHSSCNTISPLRWVNKTFYNWIQFKVCQQPWIVCIKDVKS